jgi:hypothetical protein
MKTVLIILFLTLIGLLKSSRIRIQHGGQGNCELIKGFLEKVVDTSKNTKPGVYTSCLKLLCDDKENLSNRRDFTTYITELVNKTKLILRAEIKAELDKIENKVDNAQEKGIVCGAYLITIIKQNDILDFEKKNIYETINNILGRLPPENNNNNAMITNLYTTNRGSGLINDLNALKTLNGIAK